MAEETEEVQKTETTQTTETQEGQEDTVESLKARLAQTETERDNYKQGMLNAKGKKERTLEPTKPEVKQPEQTTTQTEKTEEAQKWDENSEKFKAETLSEAQKLAREESQKVLTQTNEKKAIKEFLVSHPELQEDDAAWSEVVSNYVPKHGKESVEDIVKDLKRAHTLTRIDKGDIEGIQKEAEEEGKRKGEAQAHLEEGHTVSKTNSKKGTVSQEDAIAKRLSADLPPGFSAEKV